MCVCVLCVCMFAIQFYKYLVYGMIWKFRFFCSDVLFCFVLNFFDCIVVFILPFNEIELDQIIFFPAKNVHSNGKQAALFCSNYNDS